MYVIYWRSTLQQKKTKTKTKTFEGVRSTVGEGKELTRRSRSNLALSYLGEGLEWKWYLNDFPLPRLGSYVSRDQFCREEAAVNWWSIFTEAARWVHQLVEGICLEYWQYLWECTEFPACETIAGLKEISLVSWLKKCFLSVSPEFQALVWVVRWWVWHYSYHELL